MNIVIIDCFDTWEHRVDMLYKIMTEEGHKVKVLMSDYRHIEKERRLDKKKDFYFFRTIPYKKNMSFSRLLSHRKLSRDIVTFVEKHIKRIDLLWVLIPPNSFVKDISGVKQRHKNLKLIVDIIDLWPETMPIGVIKGLFFPWRQLRDKWISNANCVITECNLYQEKLKGVVSPKKMITIYLGRENKGYEPHLNLPCDRVSLCYLGSINNIIDIETIKEIILAYRKEKTVTLHIIGDGEKKNELISAARAAGAEVIYYGKVYDRNVKQKIMDQCHYGLNIMKPSVCVGLTMKSIDYFEFGLPIINNIYGDTWDVIKKYSCGINWSGMAINSFGLEQRIESRRFFEMFLTEYIFKEKVLYVLEKLNSDGGKPK